MVKYLIVVPFTVANILEPRRYLRKWYGIARATGRSPLRLLWYLHAIVPDGCFLGDSDLRMAPMITGKDLSEAFRHEVLSMLKKEGKIPDAVIENMMSWHHSGFHVHIGERIWPEDQQGLEDLARYIIRACFLQERMVYIPVTESTDGTANVIYTSRRY